MINPIIVHSCKSFPIFIMHFFPLYSFHLHFSPNYSLPPIRYAFLPFCFFFGWGGITVRLLRALSYKTYRRMSSNHHNNSNPPKICGQQTNGANIGDSKYQNSRSARKNVARPYCFIQTRTEFLQLSTQSMDCAD